MVFQSRADAGRQLGAALVEYDRCRPVVYGVARGGVEVARYVADALKAEFDIVVASKLAVPWNPEAGFGAVAEGGQPIYDRELVKRIGLGEQELTAIVEAVRRETERRVQAFRGDSPRVIATDRVAVVVDDGVASGYTLAAALEAVRADQPAKLVAATPAASFSGRALVTEHCDQVIALVQVGPGKPFAVGSFYRDFMQLTDAKVRELKG